MQAILALEDGTWFEGVAAGAQGETSGEVVFNTSMTGYQEVLTDPSYAGQIVTMTCPEIGNYGVSSENVESRKPQGAGFIKRDESPVESNWRASGTLHEYLIAKNIVAISHIHPRALTGRLRAGGLMRGVVATGKGTARDQTRRCVPEQRAGRSCRPAVRDRQRKTARRVRRTGLRHLPRSPDPRPRDGGQDVQAEIRSSRRESSGEEARDREGRNHFAEPRLRRRPDDAARGRRGDASQSVRRNRRGPPPSHASGVLRAVSSRSL